MRREHFAKMMGQIEALKAAVALKAAEFQSAANWREQLPTVMVPGMPAGTGGDRKYLDPLHALCVAEARLRAFQMEFDDKLLAGPPILED